MNVLRNSGQNLKGEHPALTPIFMPRASAGPEEGTAELSCACALEEQMEKKSEPSLMEWWLR